MNKSEPLNYWSHPNILLGAFAWLLCFTAPGPQSMAQAAPPPGDITIIGFWDFNDARIPTSTGDIVKSNEGALVGGAVFSEDGLGRSGQSGDRAMDFGDDNGGQYVDVTDGGFLNLATENDQVSIAYWQNLDEVSAMFTVFGWSDSDLRNRGVSMHSPWSNNSLYFDTTGCCDGATQRITASINTLGDPNFSFVGEWHHFAFIKNGATKQIWIDGALFLEGQNTSPWYGDFSRLILGAEGGAPLSDNSVIGLLDDVLFTSGALSQEQIQVLAQGGNPEELAPIPNSRPPRLILNNMSNGQVFHRAEDGVEATAYANLDYTLSEEDIFLELNGADVSANLSVEGTPDQLTITYNGLEENQAYTAVLTVADNRGAAAVKSWTFDTFSEDLLVIEAEDFNFDGGQFYDNPIFCNDLGGAENCYFDKVSIPGIDSNETGGAGDDATDFESLYRFGPDFDRTELVDTFVSGDILRNKFADAPEGFNGPIRDYDVTQIAAEDWLNYTRTIDDDNYSVYLRVRSSAENQVELSRVSNSTAANQNTEFLGLFVVPNTAGAYAYVPLTDATGNVQLTATLGGEESLRLTANTGANNMVWNYLLFTPAAATELPPILSSVTPAFNAVNVEPDVTLEVVLQEGTTPIDVSSVELKLNGAEVPATVDKSGKELTVAYTPDPWLESATTYSAELTYVAGTEYQVEWQFTVKAYYPNALVAYWPFNDDGDPTSALDEVSQTPGFLENGAAFAADGGGFTGMPGDRAVDFGQDVSQQLVRVSDVSFLAPTSQRNQITISFWQKHHSIGSNQTAIWAVSPSSSGTMRGLSLQAPWSNNSLYYDTGGCCDGATQRINQAITTFPDYNDFFWLDWHNIVITKNGSLKKIYIDGVLFHQGNSTLPLPSDFSELLLGAEPATGDPAMHGNSMIGLIDDLAIFANELTAEDVALLAAGTPPTDVADEIGVVVAGEFNSISLEGGQVTIEWQGEGTLEWAQAIDGPWTAEAGAASPYQTTPAEPMRYYRLAL